MQRRVGGSFATGCSTSKLGSFLRSIDPRFCARPPYSERLLLRCVLFVCRSSERLKQGLDWAFRFSKPKLYYQAGSVSAALVKACPVLHREYAPPLVSFGGGMHMVLSVGTACFVTTPVKCPAAYMMHIEASPDVEHQQSATSISSWLPVLRLPK